MPGTLPVVALGKIVEWIWKFYVHGGCIRDFCLVGYTET